MSGFKFLYITDEGKVFKIPQPKGSIYKGVPELANKDVLKVILIYNTKDRKPWELIVAQFGRITLDGNGQYELTPEEVHARMRNFNNFGFATAEEISQRKGPWRIPDAPIIPTPIEKEALIKFIQTDYPLLWENSPHIVEQSIVSIKEQHQQLLNKIKEAIQLNKLKN